tara:strand:+ start:331 stop:615 length:285 start_codon:yes stop_codon:yes gene_type:complete
MKNAYKNLVRHCLNDNCLISVFDSEEYQVKRSSNYKAIIDAIESTDEIMLLIRDSEKNKLGKAWIIHDCDLDEKVWNFTDNDYMNKWFDQFFAS